MLKITMAEITILFYRCFIKGIRISLKLLHRGKRFFIKEVIMMEKVNLELRLLAFFPQITADLFQLPVMLHVFIFHTQGGHVIFLHQLGQVHGIM